MNVTTAASVLLALVVACTNSTAPEAADHQSSAIRASEPAADILGTWRFDLDASEVASAVHEDCASKSDPTTCWNEISAQAKREKVRFTKENGHAVWTSFAQEGSREVLFVTIPVELTADGKGHVLAKLTGPASGPHAEHFAKSSINQLRVELVDERTIALTSPTKGRLVYSKE